jgi:hypothetical protein
MSESQIDRFELEVNAYYRVTVSAKNADEAMDLLVDADLTKDSLEGWDIVGAHRLEMALKQLDGENNA